MSGEHTAVGDELITRAAPSAPRPTGATVGVSRSDEPGPAVGVKAVQPAVKPTAQPGEQEQVTAPTHGYDFSKLDIPAEHAPYINDVANHIRAEGGDQAHAELGARVALRMQEAQDKADKGLVALTAREMRSKLGDAQFNETWTAIQNYAKGLPPEIQNDYLWMAIKSPNGFRYAWADAIQPYHDPGMPQPSEPQRTEAAPPIGTRAYWDWVAKNEALTRAPKDGVYVRGDRRLMKPAP